MIVLCPEIKIIYMKGEIIFMKTLEVLLNIASYGVLAMISVTVIKIGMKIFRSQRR